MSEPTEYDQHLAAQEKEYGTYVATAVITFDGARAFNPGDPVPVSHVKAYRYDEAGLVAKRGTKAAEKVAATPETPKG